MPLLRGTLSVRDDPAHQTFNLMREDNGQENERA